MRKKFLKLKPKSSYEAFTSYVKLSSVVAKDFVLSKAFKVPKRVWQQLPQVQPRPDKEAEVKSDASAGASPKPLEGEQSAAVPEPSQEEQVSEFERLRLGQIQCNRAQLALLGLGESAPIVSGDAPKAASKARPRPGRNDGPLRRSARLQ